MSVLSTWFLGGGSAPARFALCLLGSLAPFLTLAGVRERRSLGESALRPLLPLIPWLGFNAVVLLGLLHPGLRTATVEGITVFIPTETSPSLPSSARPELAASELWLLNSIVLSAFNLLVNIRHRHALRTLFVVFAANALALAVFGSLQKFVNAPGLFFGGVRSPNSTFFASFIYHNHWGSFVILSLAVCLGLLFNLRPWSGSRDFWHSPAPAAVMAIFFLSLTAPLSGARACTFLAVLLLAVGLIHGLLRVVRHQRDRARSALGPTLMIAVTALVAVGASFFLSREVIGTRLADTRTQFAQLQESGGLGARGILYQDTARMIADKPWFGWGLASYATVFRFYNTQVGREGLPHFYEYAHSDWLQLIAETGIAGTACYLCFLLLALRPLRHWRGDNELPAYLLAGCGLIVLYACIEFPFGNPAVSLLFWTCLLGAVRWVRLSQPAATR